jgi:sensory rhodopsin
VSNHILIPETTLYLGTAGVLFAGALFFAAIGARSSGTRRRIVFWATLPALGMAIGYVCMGLDILTVQTSGREQSAMRFVGYTAVLVGFSSVLRELVGLSFKQLVVLIAVLLITPWMSFASWLTVGTGESLANALAFAGYLGGTYALLRPVARLSREQVAERRLLYGKLRNLFVLCWGILILQSVISEQSLGLTDLFVGQLGASYTDVLFMLGIGGLVVANRFVFAEQ